jgi:hypothetical protein
VLTSVDLDNKRVNRDIEIEINQRFVVNDTAGAIARRLAFL